MKNELRKKVVGILAKVSFKEAEKNANSACVFLHGQPEMPVSVKKLNKLSK